MRQLYLELKNLQFYYLVPPVALFVLLPLTVIATVNNGSGGNFSECGTISQLIIPSFSVWWPLFVLKEYLNSPGKELLFVHKGLYGLLIRMLVLWGFFALHVTVVFIYFTTLFDYVWFLFVVVIIQSMFMIALGYFLSLLFQNTFVALIMSFSYSLVFMLALFYSPLSIFETGSFTKISSLSKSVVVAAVALVLFYMGFRIEERLHKNTI